MEIRCSECQIHLGDIAGKLRVDKTVFICSDCLKRLKTIRNLSSTKAPYDDLMDLFGKSFTSRY